MRVLFVGLGSIGQRHLVNLRSLVSKLEPIAFRSRGLDTEALVRDHGLRTVPSLADGLAEQPELAIVATPTSLHLETARAVLDAGVPLLLEKPVAASWAGVVDLVQRAEAKAVPVVVGFNLRLHPALHAAKQGLLDGRIGKPLTLRAEVGQHLSEWHPGEDYRQGYSAQVKLGGGVILDLSHELDVARWFLGPVASVQAMAGKLSDLAIETEDVAEILLGHESRSISSVRLDYVRRPARRAIRVMGNDGTMEIDLLACAVRAHSAKGGIWEPTLPPFDRNDMYRSLMRNVLEVLDGRAAPVVDLREGAEVQRLAMAAKKAALTGRGMDVTGPIEEWRDE